jgi:hypothetical protein
MANKVQQRLVLRTHVLRIQMGRQRFDALALQGQHQTSAIVLHWGDPINVAERSSHVVQVVIKIIRLHRASPREDDLFYGQCLCFDMHEARQ